MKNELAAGAAIEPSLQIPAPSPLQCSIWIHQPCSCLFPACFALNISPGPNNLLSINNATRFGFRHACIGGLGRLVAFAGMMALSSIGMAVVLHTSEALFFALKLAGAAYLVYLACQLWHAPETLEKTGPLRKFTLAGLMRQEFLIAAGNPKAILIFTAFLLQFVNPALPVARQFLLLGVLFLLLESIAIVIYAGIGIHLRCLFTLPHAKRLFNRCCASMLAMAGIGVLLSRRSPGTA